MPEIGANAIALMLQGATVGGIGALFAILFGVWDRKKKYAKEDRDSDTADEKDFEERRARFLAEVIADRDLERRRREEADRRCDDCEAKRMSYWRAGRVLEDHARDLRHMLANLIMGARRLLGPEQWKTLDVPDTLPPVPSLTALIAAEKPGPPPP